MAFESLDFLLGHKEGAVVEFLPEVLLVGLLLGFQQGMFPFLCVKIVVD